MNEAAERDELAECLAFISDLALTGHDVVLHDTAAAADLLHHSQLPTTTASASPHRPDKVELGDPDELQVGQGLAADEHVLGLREPATDSCHVHGSTTGRARWLRLQRQRSAPPTTATATATATADHTVSSHIQMLNSLDSQVTFTIEYKPYTHSVSSTSINKKS